MESSTSPRQAGHGGGSRNAASASGPSGETAGEWADLAEGSARGLLYVPSEGTATRLVVLFHGAGQSPRSVQGILGRNARQQGFALLLPQSADRTWDAIRGQAGPDLEALEQLLAAASGRVPVAPRWLSVAGFSDGASYALGVGLAFGARFSEIMAFSPGFVAQAGQPAGMPRIFVSHGRDDSVLPIARTSRRLVPALQAAGYSVHYEEFDGGHTVPASIADDATRWLLGNKREEPV